MCRLAIALRCLLLLLIPITIPIEPVSIAAAAAARNRFLLIALTIRSQRLRRDRAKESLKDGRMGSMKLSMISSSPASKAKRDRPNWFRRRPGVSGHRLSMGSKLAIGCKIPRCASHSKKTQESSILPQERHLIREQSPGLILLSFGSGTMESHNRTVNWRPDWCLGIPSKALL